MGVVGDAISSLVSSSKSKKAAKAITQAADTNNALQGQVYAENKANLTPFMQTGLQAGKAANDFLGLNGATGQNAAFDTWRNATGYQDQKAQGVDAITSSKALGGLLKSGSTLKAVNTFGQNLANTSGQQYLGNLFNQQGVGLSGANALAGVGTNYVNGVSANNNNAAGAKADNYINQANIFSNFLSNAEKRASQAFGSSYG